MSATMARQGDWVQLELSDMHLPLSVAKLAKGGFSCSGIGETQYRLNNPQATVQKEMLRGVEISGHKHVMAAMKRHPVMLQENRLDGCLPCQNGTAQNPQTLWRHERTGAPQPERLRQPTPNPMSHPPRTPPVPPSDNEGAQTSEIEGVPLRYVYIHTPHPSAQFFNFDAYAKDCKCDKDCNPDLLTDEGTSTG